jgi:hypothetical protein
VDATSSAKNIKSVYFERDRRFFIFNTIKIYYIKNQIAFFKQFSYTYSKSKEMKKIRSVLLIAIFTITITPAYATNEEVPLFNNAGKPEAYIAIDEALTIYLWSGKPVAYLERNKKDGYDVYGFNGKHLGWFLKNAIWDHNGNASCATKEVMAITEYEPYKAYKQYKPYKSYKEYAPYMPYLSNSFGEMPCLFLLGSGAE